MPLVDRVLLADEKHRSLMQESQKLRHERNKITSEISQLKKQGKDVSVLLKKAKLIPDRIKEIEVIQEKLFTLIQSEKDSLEVLEQWNKMFFRNEKNG